MLLAVFLRLFQVGRESLWYDELYAIWASSLPLGEVAREALASLHPPLYYLMSHFVLLAGDGELWYRMISVASGVFSVWVVYLIGRELYTRSAGLWAASFAAISPLLVWYSREATSYALLAAMSLASLLFLVRGIDRGGWKNWAGYAVFTGLTLATSFAAVVILPAGLLFWLIQGKQRKKLDKRGFLLIAVVGAGGAAAVLFALAGSADLLLLPASLSTFTFKFLANIVDAPAVLVGGPNVYEVVRYVMAAKILFFVALPTGIFAAAIYSQQFKERLLERKTLALLAYALVLLVGPVLLYAFLDDITASYRFFSWSSGALLLLVGAFVAGSSTRPRLIAGAAIILVLGVLVVPVLTKDKWDMRRIVATIGERQQADDVILCFPVHHCVVAKGVYDEGLPPVLGGYVIDGIVNFLPKGTSWHGYGTGEIREKSLAPPSESVLRQQQDDLLAGYDRVWLLEGDNTSSAYRSAMAVEYLLEEDWQLRGQWHYTPLILKLYQRESRQ
ncbi:MAG: glycosyltransferase family 39 protein [Thermoleophilia bacterium]